MDTYERLVITNIMYVPIETKIDNLHYYNNDVSFELNTGTKKIYCKTTPGDVDNASCKNPCLGVSCCLCAPCVGLGTGILTMLSLPFLYIYKKIKITPTKHTKIDILIEHNTYISKVLHSSYNEPCNILIEIVNADNNLCKIIRIMAPKLP